MGMLLPKWLAMTMKTSAESNGLEKTSMGIEDIVESLRSVGDDIHQIVKLTSEEKVLVAEFLSVLKKVSQRMFSVPVSTSELPARIQVFTETRIDYTGHLILTTEDGRMVVMDYLREIQNRDMMAVVNDIIPKFQNLVTQLEQEKLRNLRRLRRKHHLNRQNQLQKSKRRKKSQ